MSVLIIEDSSQNKFGGGQKVTLDVINVLRKKSKVYLIDHSLKSVFLERAKELVHSVIILKSCRKIDIFIFDTVFLLFFSLINCYKYLIAVSRLNPDLVYVATKRGLIYANLSRFLFGMPFVYHAHLIERSRFVKFFLWFALKNCDEVVCVSNAVFQSLSVQLNKKLLYNSIPSNSYVKPRNIRGKVVVGFFGSIIKTKGVSDFIRSYDYLTSKLEIEFWIFGEGSMKSKLEKFTCHNRNIKFFGHVDDVTSIMRQHIDIICLASTIPESFGMVILEGFSEGIPVITTNIGGQSEIVSHGIDGFLCSVGNYREIAARIDYLMDSPKYFEFSVNAIKKSKLFSLISFEKDLMKILSSKISKINHD